MKKQGAQVSSPKHVTFAVRPNEDDVLVTPPLSSSTDVTIQLGEDGKALHHRQLSQSDIGSQTHLPPIVSSIGARKGSDVTVACRKDGTSAPKKGTDAIAKQELDSTPKKGTDAMLKKGSDVTPKAEKPATTRALQKSAPQAASLYKGSPQPPSPSMQRSESPNRRWSTDTAVNMTKHEALDMFRHVQRALEDERRQAELKAIKERVHKVLVSASMVDPVSHNEEDGEDDSVEPWISHVELVHSEDRGTYEETFQQRDNIRTMLSVFEETVQVCNDSLDSLREFFARNMDLCDGLMSPEYLEEKIQWTEGLAQDLGINLERFIGYEDKLLTTSESLLSMTTHILSERPKLSESEKLPVIDAEAMMVDAEKWNMSVKALKKIHDDGVRRIKKSMTRNLLKYSQRQYNQLLKVAETRHETFAEKQRQLSDIDNRYSHAQKRSDHLQKEADELKWALNQSQEETTEWKQVVANLEEQNDRLVTTITNLKAKIGNLEKQIQEEKRRAEAPAATTGGKVDKEPAMSPIAKLEMELRADQMTLTKLSETETHLLTQIAVEKDRAKQLEELRAKTLSMADTLQQNQMEHKADHVQPYQTEVKGITEETGSAGKVSVLPTEGREPDKKKRRVKKSQRTKESALGTDPITAENNREVGSHLHGSGSTGNVEDRIQSGTQEVDGSQPGKHASTKATKAGIQSVRAKDSDRKRLKKSTTSTESTVSSEEEVVSGATEQFSEGTSTVSSDLLSEADLVSVQRSVVSLVHGFIHFHTHLHKCLGSQDRGIHEGAVLQRLKQVTEDMLMSQPRLVIGQVLNIIVKYLQRMEEIMIAFYRSFTEGQDQCMDDTRIPQVDFHVPTSLTPYTEGSGFGPGVQISPTSKSRTEGSSPQPRQQTQYAISRREASSVHQPEQALYPTQSLRKSPHSQPVSGSRYPTPPPVTSSVQQQQQAQYHGQEVWNAPHTPPHSQPVMKTSYPVEMKVALSPEPRKQMTQYLTQPEIGVSRGRMPKPAGKIPDSQYSMPVRAPSTLQQQEQMQSSTRPAREVPHIQRLHQTLNIQQIMQPQYASQMEEPAIMQTQEQTQAIPRPVNNVMQQSLWAPGFSMSTTDDFRSGQHTQARLPAQPDRAAHQFQQSTQAYSQTEQQAGYSRALKGTSFSRQRPHVQTVSPQVSDLRHSPLAKPASYTQPAMQTGYGVHMTHVPYAESIRSRADVVDYGQRLQYQDRELQLSFSQDFHLVPNILKRMERMEQRAEAEARAVNGRLFQSEIPVPDQAMAASGMVLETEKMFQRRQGQIGPMKILRKDLQGNLKLLNDAVENGMITEDVFVEAASATLKALEMPDRRLRVFFHRYLAYRRQMELENNIISILDDEEEDMSEVTQLCLGMYLDEADGRNERLANRWIKINDAIQTERMQLNKQLFRMVCRLYTQHGLTLIHPLVEYPSVDEQVQAPRQGLPAIRPHQKPRLHRYPKDWELIQGTYQGLLTSKPVQRPKAQVYTKDEKRIQAPHQGLAPDKPDQSFVVLKYPKIGEQVQAVHPGLTPAKHDQSCVLLKSAIDEQRAGATCLPVPAGKPGQKPMLIKFSTAEELIYAPHQGLTTDLPAQRSILLKHSRDEGIVPTPNQSTIVDKSDQKIPRFKEMVHPPCQSLQARKLGQIPMLMKFFRVDELVNAPHQDILTHILGQKPTPLKYTVSDELVSAPCQGLPNDILGQKAMLLKYLKDDELLRATHRGVPFTRSNLKTMPLKPLKHSDLVKAAHQGLTVDHFSQRSVLLKTTRDEKLFPASQHGLPPVIPHHRSTLLKTRRDGKLLDAPLLGLPTKSQDQTPLLLKSPQNKTLVQPPPQGHISDFPAQSSTILNNLWDDEGIHALRQDLLPDSPMLLRDVLEQQQVQQGEAEGTVLYGSAVKPYKIGDYWSQANCLRLTEQAKDPGVETTLSGINIPHVLSYDINRGHIQAGRSMKLKTTKVKSATA